MNAEPAVSSIVPLPFACVLHLVCLNAFDTTAPERIALASGIVPERREARTVGEALSHIDEIEPEAVLLDARSCDGLARGVLHALSSRRCLPPQVVVVTESRDVPLISAFLSAGAAGFVCLDEARSKSLHRESYVGLRARPRSDDRVSEEVAFYSAISHDIRAPLGVILGALSELRHESEGLLAHQRKLLDLMQRSGERLLGLAQTLTDLGAPPPVNPRYEDVALLAREITDEMAHSWGTRGKAIALEAQGPILAAIDRQDFGRILTNLLTNGLRYARSTVKVRLELAGTDLLLSIRDDGPGVSADLLPVLFRSVAPRSYTSRTRVGLGLTIVREIAERYGGTASAQNELEEGRVVGASFVVRLRAHGVRLAPGPAFTRSI